MHFLCTFGCILALIKMHGDFGDVSERSLVTKGSVCTLWITVPTFLLCFLTAEPIRGTSLHSCSPIGSKFKPRPYPSALMLLPLHTRQRSTTGCLFVSWSPPSKLSSYNFENLKCCCFCAWLWVGWTACGHEDRRVHNASVCDVTILPYMFSRTN